METKRIVEDPGRGALLLPGDLADRVHCARLIDDTVAGLGCLDVLVNNAGPQDRTVPSFEDLDPDRIERAFQVNIIAMFHLVRAAVRHMNPGSTIVNTASIQAYQPNPSILDYAATKGAIVTFTKSLCPGDRRTGYSSQLRRARPRVDSPHRSVLRHALF